MIPSSKKKKESVATRRVPPPADASQAQGGAQPATTAASAQKFRVWPEVWPEDRRERIATKAYALWEQRGCRHGDDLEDWLDAEALVIEMRHDAPE